MPIPNDPLQRWWVEAGAENPQYVEQLRPILIAFMAFKPGREACLAGSGFFVAGNREFALAITAKHVLTEGVGRAQTPWSTHASSALFVNSSAPALTLDPQKLKIICMVSLDGMTIDEHVPPTDASGKGQTIAITRRVSIRVGVVTGVYPDGLRHYRWPCFTTSIPAEPGMSGGFVTLPREGKTIAACGIICADSSADEARANSSQCGESIIACAWPALALRAPEAMPSIPTTPTLTLHEMMLTGRMDTAVGGIDRIEIIEQENGDCSIGIRA
jgi:hypothetical protein